MGKGFTSYLAMKKGGGASEATQALIDSDLRELGVAARKLANHAFVLGGGLGFGTHFLKWLAFIAAVSVLSTTSPLSLLVFSPRDVRKTKCVAFGWGSMIQPFLSFVLDLEAPAFANRVKGYLLILDRTNWKTNMLTGLLVPYIFFTLPHVLFSLIRGEVGKWIAIIVVILRLFFPRHFPDWLELPGAIILLTAVAPSIFADTFRSDLVGVFICLGIGCYLLQEHIRASGGFRNAFRKGNGVSNSIGILLLFIYPVWALVLNFL